MKFVSKCWKWPLKRVKFSKISGGGHASRCPPKSLRLQHLLYPLPPLKVLEPPLDLLEISHTQQFFNLGTVKKGSEYSMSLSDKYSSIYNTPALGVQWTYVPQAQWKRGLSILCCCLINIPAYTTPLHLVYSKLYIPQALWKRGLSILCCCLINIPAYTTWLTLCC